MGLKRENRSSGHTQNSYPDARSNILLPELDTSVVERTLPSLPAFALLLPARPRLDTHSVGYLAAECELLSLKLFCKS